MNPYREIAQLSELPNKSRPFYKTIYFKLLIKLKGKWKVRFKRCHNCLYYHAASDGMHYDSRMVFHQFKCHALRLHAEKALQEYRKNEVF